MESTKQERNWPDLATHRRDKYGKLAEVKHYRMHIQKVDGVGDVKVFEVPPGSKNLFYERDGFFSEPAGRLDEKGKIQLGVPHVAYIAPISDDRALELEMQNTKTKNESLQAELAALKAEMTALEEKLKTQETKKAGK